MARNYTRKFYVPIKLYGKSQVVGTPTVTVLEYDSSGKVLLATGTTVPTDTDAGYAKGCLFIKTNGSAGSVLYLNEGSSTSADFNVVESAASTVTGVTADSGLLGGGTEGSVTVSRGLAVRNQSGGTLTKGTLVRVTGYASSKPLITKADADTAGAGAVYVLTADIANNTNGNVYGVATVTGINTDAVSAIGDPLYLSATAGEFAASAPTGADQVVQRVGVVTVKNATTGEALFFPEYLIFEKIGTSGIQNDAISQEHLDDGILPSHVVKYAGKHTWTGSGATAQASVSGVAATDVVVASISTKPTQAAYLVAAAPGTDVIDFELSAANTGNDAVISYSVLRAAA